MLSDLVQTIETLRERIREHRSVLAANETRTRMALIDPLLRALEWDVSDPSLVTPEYSVEGGKADYALRNAGPTPAAFIEAKKLDDGLDPHREQMTRYSNMAGVRYAGLTDGNRWELYEVFKPVPLNERRILDVSILNDATHQLALKLLLLWRPNLESNAPVEPQPPVLAPNPTAIDPAEPVRPAPHSPVVPVSPVAPSGEGWVRLTDEFAPTGTKAPTAVRFPDGQEKPTRI